MAEAQEGPGPHIPQRELDKAYGLGRTARETGKPEDACPFFLPQMREEWLRGFRCKDGYGKARIHLRDCPMCHEGVHDEGVILTSENLIDPYDGEEYHAISYTVRCCNCGASVSHEYLPEAVRLWNGEPPQDEEADT